MLAVDLVMYSHKEGAAVHMRAVLRGMVGVGADNHRHRDGKRGGSHLHLGGDLVVIARRRGPGSQC